MIITLPTKRIGAVLSTAFAAAALAFALGPASPAYAHDQLVGSDPVDGAVLEVAPEELSLSFNNKIIEVGTVFNVTSADGTSVVDGEPRVAGMDVHQALQADLPDGSYQAVWRVVSSDGHPITGVFGFTVGDAIEAEAPAASENDSDHASEQEHADEQNSAPSGPPEESVLASPLLWAGIAGSLALIVVVVVVTTRSAKRRATDAGPSGSADQPDDSTR